MVHRGVVCVMVDILPRVYPIYDRVWSGCGDISKLALSVDAYLWAFELNCHPIRMYFQIPKNSQDQL